MKFRPHKKQADTRTGPRSVTGSSRAPVFSYHAQRSHDARNTGRYETLSVPRRSLRPSLKYVPSWIASFAIIASLFYASTLQSNAIIDITTPSGSLNRSEQAYHDVVSASLRSTPLSYTKWTIQTDMVANDLQDAFPEVQRVSVNLPLLGRRPIIQIKTAEPVFLLASTNGAAYYIDSDGRAVLRPGDLDAPLPGVVTVRDTSGIEVGARKQIVPTATVAFIQDITKQFAEKSISIEHIELPAVAYEVRVKPKDQSHYVKFYLEEESRVQIGAYFAARDEIARKKLIAAEYVDVRIPGRLFVK